MEDPRQRPNRKFEIYRDDLGVREYFLFDPEGRYLDPPLVGYRLVRGDYEPIEPVDGRLPSEVMGVHLERVGELLHLYDPQTGGYVRSTEQRETEARARAEQAEAALRARDAELDALRRELEALKRRSGEPS